MTEYLYPDLPNSVEEVAAIFQERVDRHLSLYSIETLETLDEEFAGGAREASATTFEADASVPWEPYAEWMENRGLSQSFMEAVLAKVKWFEPEVADWFENRTPPEQPDG